MVHSVVSGAQCSQWCIGSSFVSGSFICKTLNCLHVKKCQVGFIKMNDIHTSYKYDTHSESYLNKQELKTFHGQIKCNKHISLLERLNIKDVAK